jgi:hypothetical protein
MLYMLVFLKNFPKFHILKLYTYFCNSNYIGYAFPRVYSKISSLQRSCAPTASVEMIDRRIRVRSLLLVDAPTCHVTLPHTKTVQRNEDVQKLVLLKELELAPFTTILCNTTITSLSFTRSIADLMHRSTDCESNCLCIRCAFEKSTDVLSIKSGVWILGSESVDLSNCDALILAGTYQSEMKLKFAAAMYARVILSYSSEGNEAHLLGDALHGLASLLLEATTIIDTDVNSAIAIRKHWRSSTKLWLAANALVPVCSMAQREEHKLRAFGRYSFLKNAHDLTAIEREDLKSVSFSNVLINDSIDAPGIFKKRSHSSAFQSTTTHRICVTTEPIISHDDCKFLIDTAELHAQKSGWTTSRHYSVPTTDIPIQECSLLLDWFFSSGFYDRLRSTLHKQFPDAFDGCPESMYINDAFIVRYSARSQEKIDPLYSEKILWDGNLINVSATTEDRQCFLPIHTDQSTHSVVISLNSDDEYTGGGTYFAGLSSPVEEDYATACSIKYGVVLPARGNMVSFEGCRLKHAGEPISSGKRYIVALFLFLGREQKEFDIADSSVDKMTASTTDVFQSSNKEGCLRRAEDVSRDQVTFGFNFYE